MQPWIAVRTPLDLRNSRVQLAGTISYLLRERELDPLLERPLPFLNTLIIDGYFIRQGSPMSTTALLLFLQKHPNVTQLSLKATGIDPSFFLTNQESLEHLRDLDISENGWGPEGYSEFFRAEKLLESLSILRVDTVQRASLASRDAQNLTIL